MKVEFAPKMQKRIGLVDPLLVYSWWHAGMDNKEHQAVMEKAIRRQVKQTDVALVPVFELHPAHWTLLVVDLQQKTCRYYDSLDESHIMCKLLADSMVACLKQKWTWLPEKLPERHNHCRHPPVMPETANSEARFGILAPARPHPPVAIQKNGSWRKWDKNPGGLQAEWRGLRLLCSLVDGGRNPCSRW